MDNKKNGIPKLRFPGFTGAWEQRKLGEIGKVFTGNTPSTKNTENWTTDKSIGHVWITPTDINNNIMFDSERYLSDKGWSQARVVPKNSVLITSIASIGKNAINGVEVAFNQQINALVVQKNNPYFILTLMNKEKQRFESLAGQTATPIINKSTFSSFMVKIPSETEQEQIGEFFKQLDSLIALHQRKLEHLQEQKKGLLQKMFPKNGETVPEVRFPGFTDAWEQRKLGEVVNFLDTLRKPLEGAKRVKGPYPYYGASGIVDYVDGYLFDEELILLSEDGANITERNYPVCFLASGKYWVNNHAHVLKIKEDNDNNFICNSLERKDYTKYNTGMAMPKLNKETCKGIPIMCPNYDEQKKIGNYFRKFDTLIALHQRKLDHLELMKKGLLQQMFV